MTPTLHIDFESRSAVDLRKTGVYVYAEDETTDVWCAAYCIDDGPIDLIAQDDFGSPDFRKLLFRGVREGWTFVAHNASFERQIFAHIMGPRYGWPVPRLEQWRCTMAQAYAMALPGSLEEAAPAVGLEISKDLAGKRLMMQMARPRKVTETAAGPTYTWWDDDDRKRRLYAYCRQDVEVERQLDKRLYRLSPDELRLWHLDQRINDRGVQVDVELCDRAKAVVKTTTNRLNAEMRKVTLGEVPACSNAAALVAWLATRGVITSSVDKAHLDELLARDDLPADARRALEIRKEAAKSSVAKIDALLRGTSRDGGARGLLQFHAASTGRWAGRRFQPQNLPRPIIVANDDDEIAERLQADAIRCIKTGRAEIVEALQGPPLTIVGDCIRGTVVARPGAALNVADFSNIEGRVLAWLAGEFRKLDAFRAYDAGTGPDLYKVAAADIYRTTAGDVTKDQRQIGKVSELACGYQGGVGAFQTMATTYRVKVPDEKAAEIVRAWRLANPEIVQFWRDLEERAVVACQEPGEPITCGPVRFVVRGSMLGLQLPSGRVLSYAYPKLVDKVWVLDLETLQKRTMRLEAARAPERDGLVAIEGAPLESVTYMGINSYTRKWERQDTYGGKWAENITQAVARDVMREAMFRVEAADYPIVLTVHDELVCEPAAGHGSAEEFNALVAELPVWAVGLPVAADGWRGGRYRK